MSSRNPQNNFNPARAIKKFFLSAFVVISFIAYAVHKPNNSGNKPLGLSTSPQTGGASQQTLVPSAQVAAPTNTAVPPATSTPESATAPQQVIVPTETPAAPTAVPPTATAQAASVPNTTGQTGLKDGTYTGPEVDAFYGLVKVQVVVQNGKITNVQVPEYPSDRRTSQRINSYAVPYLQQEAVQAQSANVDLITGATLTSQAFQQSLQAALSKAKGNL